MIKKKVKKKKVSYSVYNIIFNGVIVYWGRTTNIRTRQNRHNNDCFKLLINKTLYNYLRNNGADSIILNEVYVFDDKVKSKRMEMYQILTDYINNNMVLTLKQTIPRISDM